MKNNSIENSRSVDGAEFLAGLSHDEWLDLLNRLRLFAARHNHGKLDVEDLVMKAITDVLTGRRNSWNAAYTPLGNLCLIIKSIASNQIAKDARLEFWDLTEKHVLNALSRLSHSSPEDIYEKSEIQEQRGRLIHRAVRGDRVLGQIVEFAIERNSWKPNQIAAELNIRKSEVYSARRRFRRRLSLILRKSRSGLGL